MNTSLYPVTDLIRGSAELDRKKKEIQTIVAMLRGMVQSYSKKPNIRTTMIPYGGKFGVWQVTTDAGENEPCLVCIKYYTPLGGTVTPDEVGAEDVNQMHTDLQILVDAFVNLFPKSTGSGLQPFMDAAKTTA